MIVLVLMVKHLMVMENLLTTITDLDTGKTGQLDADGNSIDDITQMVFRKPSSLAFYQCFSYLKGDFNYAITKQN